MTSASPRPYDIVIGGGEEKKDERMWEIEAKPPSGVTTNRPVGSLRFLSEFTSDYVVVW